ncbi:hypothetical protein [Nostoc sp. FACHB-110]|uniref:hypothetical protein n=1 Tax=Nostoc sp. FACHB-110 TaxID=2692834 RepID=UPI0016863496|nr:hypothetical protein [Nostoc sp. FACHB-110]MBD2438188.1 hypothetical protein [Nostoc sp. FACHB-110]
MVTLVVIINTLISLMLLFIAWQIWQIKQRIALITDRLNFYEQCSYAFLSQAPINLEISQRNINNLRQGNQSLQLKIQQVQQIVSLLLLANRYFPRRNSAFLRKTATKATKSSGNIPR